MTKELFDIGDLVISIKGRDSGSVYMIITKPTDKLVRVVDGDLRKTINPKLKNVLHIKHTGINLDKIKEKLLSSEKVFDSEIYSAIKKSIESKIS